jgi:hypothetical protein
VNPLSVFTRKATASWDDPEAEAQWFGHWVYRCTVCRKGYFRVRSLEDYDPQCDNAKCKANVTVKRTSQ